MQPDDTTQGRNTRVRSISILNFKGGVGKTSLAINLADELSRRGKVVLLVDCDRQRNASTLIPRDVTIGLTLREVLMGQATLLQAMYEARTGLYVVPAHTNLEQAAKHITVSSTRTLKALKYGVESLDGVDFVLFDHAPSYSTITDVALLASKEMLIPVELEAFSVTGLVDMIHKLTDTLAELEHEVAVAGIVPSNLDYTKSMTALYLQSLKEKFGDRVTAPIRTDAQISKSQSLSQSVFEYNPHSKGAQDYAAIARLLLEQEVLVS
jgi:chromosome partitioning protein